MSGLKTIAAWAPAKLNLGLWVGAPEDDGMHPACTRMVTLDQPPGYRGPSDGWSPSGGRPQSADAPAPR